MFRLFQWLKIVMITVLLTQHSFAIAKPMNCEEHHKDSSNTQIIQPSKDIHHQSMGGVNNHHIENFQSSKHKHADEECEKCKAGDCLCCEGGLCISFHLSAYLVQEEEESSSNINLDLIIQRIPSSASGIHLLPYRPPIIG